MEALMLVASLFINSIAPDELKYDPTEHGFPHVQFLDARAFLVESTNEELVSGIPPHEIERIADKIGATYDVPTDTISFRSGRSVEMALMVQVMAYAHVAKTDSFGMFDCRNQAHEFAYGVRNAWIKIKRPDMQLVPESVIGSVASCGAEHQEIPNLREREMEHEYEI